MSELSELFARDPLKLSEQDIGTIVARMREAQAQHELGIKTVVAPKAPKEKKAVTGKALDLLKDLGLSDSDDPLKDLGLK
jgi:hypothetical protein